MFWGKCAFVFSKVRFQKLGNFVYQGLLLILSYYSVIKIYFQVFWLFASFSHTEKLTVPKCWVSSYIIKIVFLFKEDASFYYIF